MILSDRTIREEIVAGRITIDPFDDAAIQPSSVDLRLDRHFRVFLNHTMSVIDVREDLRDLTELVEIADGEAFILHPGEFVLGSTYERVGLPDDVVARIEGKSSLGRLGLLIHSSLPASEQLLVLDDKGLVLRTIVEIVKEPRPCKVVSFDPNTFEVSYHDVTGCFEGPADRIFEVRLASGRSVRVTAGHNLFTLDTSGELRKVRTTELAAGLLVAVPRSIPEPANPRNQIAVLSFVPERERYRLCFEGPSVARRLQDGWSEVSELLKQYGYSPSYYRRRSRLPWQVAAELPGMIDGLGPADRVSGRAERHTIPAVIEVDADIAWMLGMYVAEGYRRYKQLVISNNDQARLDRLEATFHRLGLPLYRSAGAVTCCSRLVSDLFGWLGMGGRAPTKRLPPMVFGWPDNLLQSFHDGLVDGDGSIAGGRTSIWTTSVGLVSDALLMSARLGRRAACSRKVTKTLPLWQVYAPDREHKLLTSLPLPDDLLRRVRSAAQLDQTQASRLAGYRHSTSLSNIENRSNRDAVHVATLRRLRDVYAAHGVAPDMLQRLSRLVDGGLAWDRVVEVVDTGEYESIYDVEVRPSGRKIENFLAGSGGVFVANTAGFIDAGFDGHLTLELSNVANLPITLYPGMKIGQVSFLKMTTPADVPYGSAELGSKYQHQRGPTPSRYFENLTGREHQ